MAQDNIFRKTHKILNRVVDALSVVVLIFVTIAVFVSVASRYFFKTPLEWSEEMARYAFIWLVFLGVAMAEKTGDHFRIEYFVHKMTPKTKLIVDIFLNTLIFVTLYLLFVESLGYYRQGKSGISTVLQIPLNYIYIALPVSVVLTFLNRIETFITTIVDLLRVLRSTEDAEAGSPQGN